MMTCVPPTLTPQGHTGGSLCVLVRTAADAVLFSGDTLTFSAARGRLDGNKGLNHGNVEVQADSMRLLAHKQLAYSWILPGEFFLLDRKQLTKFTLIYMCAHSILAAHGRMVQFASQEERIAAVLAAAEAYAAEKPGARGADIGFH